jgi:uncharacterized membrane protein
MLCDGCSHLCLVCEKFEGIVTSETDITVLRDLRLSLSQYKNIEHDSMQGRFADHIVSKVGTMPFFYFCVALSIVPFAFPITTPYVQYVSSSFLQLVLLPLIMIAQNRQEHINKAKSQREYRMLLISDKIDELGTK